jgi:hypothetical protein
MFEKAEIIENKSNNLELFPLKLRAEQTQNVIASLH